MDYKTLLNTEQYNAMLSMLKNKQTFPRNVYVCKTDNIEAMLELEKKEGKYDLKKHSQRLEVILSNWDQICRIISEELPAAAVIESILDKIQAPKKLSEIGTPDSLLPDIVRATKDIRDKYVFSRLAWDLGVLDEILVN